MATKLEKPVEKIEDPAKTYEEIMEEYVDYTAPMTANPDERDIIVSVNGDALRIKRGETVSIKRKYLEVLREADAQRLAAIRFQREAQRASAQAIATL